MSALILLNIAGSPLEQKRVERRELQPPTPPSPPSPRIKLLPSQRFDKAFDVAIDGSVWLAAGKPTEVRHEGTVYSSAPRSAAERRLQLLNRTSGKGRDALGAYTRTEWAWRAGELAFTTGMRLYGAAVVFEQRYEGSASGTAGAGLSSRFPCFGLPEGAAPRRHWLQWDGDMAGQLYRAGVWREGARLGSGLVGTSRELPPPRRSAAPSSPLLPALPSRPRHPAAPHARGGGPRSRRALCVRPGDVAGALAPLRLHGRLAAGRARGALLRAARLGARGAARLLPRDGRGALEWRAAVCPRLVPPALRHEAPPDQPLLRRDVLLLTPSGRRVRRDSAVLAWGDALLATYGRAREGAWRRDPTLRSLGYATDNGAYYYYNLHPDRGAPEGGTYADAIARVARYARQEGIPYKYWLADVARPEAPTPV